MDALKFLEEKNRMMKTDPKSYQDLKLISSNSGLVVYVEEWSKKHPQKTRLDDFKEKYPKAKIDEFFYENVCCEYVGYLNKCPQIMKRMLANIVGKYLLIEGDKIDSNI